MQIEEPFGSNDDNRVPNAAQNATSLSGHQGGSLSVFGFLQNHAGVTRECLRALRCVYKSTTVTEPVSLERVLAPTVKLARQRGG